MIKQAPGDWERKAKNGHQIGAPLADRAARDALKAIARDIPDPADCARYLPEGAVVALLGARGDCIDDGLCRMLQLVDRGLVEAGSNKRSRFLTAYGMKVRRALREEEDS